MIYGPPHPTQWGGGPGCICRTCGKEVASYLDQCLQCRQSSTREDDMLFLKPGGEWDQRKEADRQELIRQR